MSDDSPEPGTPEIPDRIGPYKILSVIGEGGMGVVYLAEQERPIRRRVALKLIKPGMSSKAVMARFEAERQAVARMSDPTIAKIFEAGTTEQGQPFFAMEHVNGIPSRRGHGDGHLLAGGDPLPASHEHSSH